MSSISNVQQAQGFDQQQYALLIQQAQAQGVGASQVDAELLAAINGGKDFAQAVNQVSVELPELAPPNGVDNARVALFGVAPSPGAMIMSLVTEQAADQRVINAEVRAAQTEAIVANIENQAEKMRDKAMEQLVLGIVSGATQIAAGAASVHTAKVAGEASSSGVASMGKGMSSMMDGISQYVGSMADAEIKEMQAEEEQIRAMRDAVKEFDDSLKELIQKSLSSADTIQQGLNQSRARILG